MKTLVFVPNFLAGRRDRPTDDALFTNRGRWTEREVLQAREADNRPCQIIQYYQRVYVIHHLPSGKWLATRRYVSQQEGV